MATQSSSLYNEERNLLRIKESKRRNQEILQDRDTFSDNAPLFPEPYKTSKGDELSSRIQSMLGNYEEVFDEALIGSKSHHNHLLKSAKQNLFCGANSRTVCPPKPSASRPRKHPTGSELSSSESGKSCPSLLDNGVQEARTGTMSTGKKSSKQTQEKNTADRPASPVSIAALSPLLSSLSPPVELLSPLHSSRQVDSKPRGGQNLEKSRRHASKSPGLSDPGYKEGSSAVGNLVPSTQTFPKYLSNSTLPPKPTAYVRPMDGQDQVPTHSPDLKPLQEDYSEQSYESHVDLKPNTKDKFSKLPSESYETFTNEAHCVEDILKEMTHSWPPPLTAIHTPSTCTTFPKESQHVSSVKVNQKQRDVSSKGSSNPQKGSSTLENDLQISDSEETDDEVEDEIIEKPLSSSAPSSVVQSQVDSVASAQSCSVETEASETDSSSDTESDSGSSDSEENVHDTSLSDWQLGNFMAKPPAVAENHKNTVDHKPESHWESKEHEFLSSPPHVSPKTVEPPHEKVHWASQEDIQEKCSFPDTHNANETVAPRHTVGIKHPRKPVKPSFQEEPKGGLTVESEPLPYMSREPPSKERPTVKTISNDYKEPKTVTHTSEKKKHRSSHHSSSTKKCPSTQPEKREGTSSLSICPSSPKSQRQSKANHRTSVTHPAVIVREDSHRDKVLLPIGDRLHPPTKPPHKPLALIVKIELSLLSRIPGTSEKVCESKSKKTSIHDSHRKKEKSEKLHTLNTSKEHGKRKSDDREKSGDHGRPKKIKLDEEAKSSSTHRESSSKKLPKVSSENSSKEHRPQKVASPVPHKKTEKVPQKRHANESSTGSQQFSTGSSKSSSKEPTAPKVTKLEEKTSEQSKSSKGSTENNTNPFPVPSLPNGNATKPTRPQMKFEEKLYSPEHYMKEAKKLKHKADAMSDKIGKAFNYLDAAMFFIECGIAMEADVHAPKPAYTMFSETVDLIKFIMKLKNFSESSAPAHEKAFAVLCMRCQSVLYMAMFRYKKDTALKYSRTLGEHFKSSSRAAQAPSPCVARSTGTPSPLSPTPSPASSGGSQPGSNNSGGQSTSVNIPQMIHHIASSYVNITSYILHAYDIWEQADLLAKKNKDFFADLSSMVCPLALNSTMTELVHYTRQGLQWLRLESNLT